MKQILRYLKPYLGKLLAATVLIALSTLCDLLLPTWMSAILNGGIAARDFPAIAVRCLQMLAIAAVSLASILGGNAAVDRGRRLLLCRSARGRVPQGQHALV